MYAYCVAGGAGVDVALGGRSPEDGRAQGAAAAGRGIEGRPHGAGAAGRGIDGRPHGAGGDGRGIDGRPHGEASA